MNKTIIFISGWMVPQIVSKSNLVWDSSHWFDYRCIWLPSKTPTSDYVVEKELARLKYFVESFPGCTLAGHSLGGWWAANLALRKEVKINKLVLWTPLCDAGAFPIFNVSSRYHPCRQSVTNTQGPHKVLNFNAKYDLIVPPDKHGSLLTNHFNAMPYQLKGGHFYQTNHKMALNYMKDWIETQ